MSSAFVKEPEGGEAFEDLPDRPISPHPNFVTPEGFSRIEAELERLHREHAAAQEADDKASLARTARDLRYWTARRNTAQVVTAPADAAEAHFGSTVTIEREDGRRQTFRIVGEDEADPAKGTISYVSPVAQALTGKRVGDVVQAGASEAEIVAIAERDDFSVHPALPLCLSMIFSKAGSFSGSCVRNGRSRPPPARSSAATGR